ncbi:MAG: phosphoadenosine phosphosulfate reductase domain-containing protein [Candidatus Hermodarchaeia archaeon]|jgi:phosphoadenosine phosphosulfate reductase
MKKKKKKPYLGPLLLAWCDRCNVPIAKGKICGRCGGQTRHVKVTPPGDARPAFQHDRNQIIETISKQYKRSVAKQLLPENKILLLNAIPDIDCCEEVILDGQVIGLHRFRVDTLSWEFIPKLEGARRLVQLTKAKQVVIENTAVEYIVRGANLLRPGVKSAEPSIQPDEVVIGVTEQGLVVLIGNAAMSGKEMEIQERGMAIKKRYKSEPREADILPGGQTREQMLEANNQLLRNIEKEAIAFIQHTSQRYNLPDVVAFSGGKDSLAVLLLARKALPDQSFHVMFINTGIEFPETTENVTSAISELGLDNQLLVKHVHEEQFFRVLDLYGFVARDYRVCCKTVKLGPTSQLIDEHFPQGCLSYIGQRRYESHRRSASRRVWRNPWVPNQVGASPIHNWTALMIWLYLFQEEAPYNPLYQEGFERIGCMFCPASTMSEFEIIASRFPTEWNRWTSTAEKIIQKEGLSKKWLKHGFWRWKTPPVKIRELADTMKVELPSHESVQPKGSVSYNLSLTPDENSEESLINGQFTTPIDLTIAAAFLPALGDVVLDLDRMMVELTIRDGKKPIKAFFFESGLFTISGNITEKKAEQVVKTVLRGLLCTGCGTCQSLCSHDAISLDSSRALIIREKCTRCGECLRGKCPTLYAG